MTHADALSQAERERVEERLRREAGPLFSGLAMIAQAPSDATVAGQDADALAAAFRSKLDGALEQVRQRRLAGARRAVSRFMQRLETGATVPLVPFRAAS